MSEPDASAVPSVPEVPAESSVPAPALATEPLVVSEPVIENLPVNTPPSPEAVAAPVSVPAPDPVADSVTQIITQPVFAIKNLAQQALEKLQFRKKTRLEKIVALAHKKGSIVNDDVEKLLRVSDSTAQRYLGELVAIGRLRRTGKKEVARYEPLGGSNGAV